MAISTILYEVSVAKFHLGSQALSDMHDHDREYD